MQLVIEGIGQFRRIVSVGVDSPIYELKSGQEIRHISDEAWGGWRRSEIHWDELSQKIIIMPYPLSPEELAEKAEAEAEVRMMADAKLLKAIEIIVAEIEYLRPEAKPRQATFQALIDKLRAYRGG
jgi:hypothetical protein